VAGGAVAAAADRELGSGLAGLGDDAGDVAGTLDAGDERGAAVDVRGEDRARVVIGRVLGGERLVGHAAGSSATFASTALRAAFGLGSTNTAAIAAPTSATPISA
jgi:hypothetical protein